MSGRTGRVARERLGVRARHRPLVLAARADVGDGSRPVVAMDAVGTTELLATCGAEGSLEREWLRGGLEGRERHAATLSPANEGCTAARHAGVGRQHSWLARRGRYHVLEGGAGLMSWVCLGIMTESQTALRT
jgi:hypothetical protein